MALSPKLMRFFSPLSSSCLSLLCHIYRLLTDTRERVGQLRLLRNEPPIVDEPKLERDSIYQIIGLLPRPPSS